MTDSFPEEFYSLAEAAVYANVERQAIFVAIKKKELRAEKMAYTTRRGDVKYQWKILRSDLDEYRRNKYSRDKRKVDGEKLFDLKNNRVSVEQASKILSKALGVPFRSHRLYYMLRQGTVRAHKKGGAWLITQEEISKVYEREKVPEKEHKIEVV